MAAHDLERCRSLPLFAAVGPEAFRRLMTGARIESHSPGAMLLHEGACVDLLYVLLDGQVELYAKWNNRDTALAIVRPFSSFMLAAVALRSPAITSARALETSEALMLQGEAVRQAMVDDAAFAASAVRDLAWDYRLVVGALKQQKLRNGVERLASYLVTLRANESSNAGAFVLRHEKRVVASLLGMTPENLSRAFAALREHGVIVNGALVTLSNPAALMALAEPDPLMDGPAPRTRTNDER